MRIGRMRGLPVAAGDEAMRRDFRFTANAGESARCPYFPEGRGRMRDLRLPPKSEGSMRRFPFSPEVEASMRDFRFPPKAGEYARCPVFPEGKASIRDFRFPPKRAGSMRRFPFSPEVEALALIPTSDPTRPPYISSALSFL